MSELPLQELFDRLRAAGLPLGINEYEVLLRALQAGYGFGGGKLSRRDELSGREDLRTLCQLLWTKSEDEAAILNYHFDAFFAPPAAGEAGAGEEEEEGTGDTPATGAGPEAEGPAQAVAGEEERQQAGSGRQGEAAGRQAAATARHRTVAGGHAAAQVPQAVVQQDEAAARATRLAGRGGDEAPSGRYRFSADYLPITRRQMKQSWRALRRTIREGPPVELDVEETVRRFARDGMLYELVLRPRRINRAGLLLLVDHEGSMVPFHALAQRLVNTAERGGRLGRADIYYFQNWPGDFLYRDSFFNEGELLRRVLADLHPTQTAVLIFSDAGAARGRFNVGRVQATRDFLARLQRTVRNVAWLNPMPPARWPGSSAAAIAGMVPMFETGRRGMEDAIGVLRGRVVPGREPG